MHVGNTNILEQLVERSPNGVLVTGATGTLEVVNEMAFRLIPLAGNPLGELGDLVGTLSAQQCLKKL